MNHRIAGLFVTLGLIFVTGWQGEVYAQVAASGFVPKARQIHMIEADTGTVMFSQGAGDTISPASLTKLMTAETVFDALAKSEISAETFYPVSEYAWRTGGAPSRTSTMFAALKSQVRVEDLLNGLIVQAANDACIILAEGISGSDEAFARRMTQRATALGLSSSTFVNATGLPDVRNRTTVKDMVVLAQHIQKTYPQYYPLYSRPDFEWNKIFQRNKNPILAANIGVDGLGAGFSEDSGFAIVASIERGNTRLFLAMAGLASDKERLEETRRVLEWGLSSFQSRRLFEAGEVVGAASVYGGAPSHVDLVAKTPVDVFVPIDNPERLSARIVYRWPLKAPVEPGREVGTLRILSGDRLIREVPLLTKANVEKGSLTTQAIDATMELLLFWL